MDMQSTMKPILAYLHALMANTTMPTWIFAKIVPLTVLPVSKDSAVFLFSLLPEDSPLTLQPKLVISLVILKMANITIQLSKHVKLAPLVVLPVKRASECCKLQEPREDSSLIMWTVSATKHAMTINITTMAYCNVWDALPIAMLVTTIHLRTD